MYGIWDNLYNRWSEREREREGEWACVCVCVREREREGGRQGQQYYIYEKKKWEDKKQKTKMLYT